MPKAKQKEKRILLTMAMYHAVNADIKEVVRMKGTPDQSPEAVDPWLEAMGWNLKVVWALFEYLDYMQMNETVHIDLTKPARVDRWMNFVP